MASPACRLLTLVAMLLALMTLALHPMPVAAGEGALCASMQEAHDTSRPGADPVDLGSACSQHCLASASLPAGAAPVPPRAPRLVQSFGGPARLAGLSPLPLGPPPKAVAFS